ncbi:heme/hemin ABC transporter substrate-binding protein [Aquabacterium parvum]|uniref:heme/hemin ABC transporter substrate-binding protein n=1 Tax=Aquabacterium parvum TaxID=70584 RepID=UPI000718E954|nr:ABC transporter substrate-binding protein [Aquabacterium parvum]MBU0916689.1 ABC transporter substrate-binding protein [Gammaproteobacteria bacterium]
MNHRDDQPSRVEEGMHRRRLLQAIGGLGGIATLPMPWGVTGQAFAATPPREASAEPRLVCIHGSLTEVVYLLGAQHMLVGTDTTSTHPAAASQTPKVGYLRQLSAEGLLSLKPNAVLGTDEAGPPAVLAQLRQAGVPLQLVSVKHRFEDLIEKVKLVGEATRRPSAAQALTADLQNRWQATQQRVARRNAAASGSTGPRVLFIMAHGPAAMLAGADTGAHAMLAYAGARNTMAEVQGWRSLNAESAVQARPDWIVTTQESVSALGGLQKFWQLPGLALTPAGRQQRVLSFDTMALLGFGPRMPETLQALQQGLA